MRMSDWSSDVCSSDLPAQIILSGSIRILLVWLILVAATMALVPAKGPSWTVPVSAVENVLGTPASSPEAPQSERSEEHTSALQSLMRISYAVFCLKKKNKKT